MLKNERLEGQTVITAFGKVTFDKEGITRDLTEEQEKEFEGIKGYEVIEEDSKSEETDEQVEEEPTEEVPEEPEEDKEQDEESVDEQEKLTKTDLQQKTVKELEAFAEEEDIELSDGNKPEKIQEILDALAERE